VSHDPTDRGNGKGQYKQVEQVFGHCYRQVLEKRRLGALGFDDGLGIFTN